MYCPAHFAETRPEVLHALMREHPLATLVTMGDNGLNADHIPLQLETSGDSQFILRGHVARANPLWKSASKGTPALAIFRGPDAYITPSWYPTKREHGKAVPTWNYAVVHARGPLHFIEDAEWLRAQVDALTQQQESNLAEPWAVSDAPADYVEKMLAAIVGVEMTVISLEGKWKVSQNQPEGNRDGVVAGLCGLGRADAAALIRRD
ncbi:MAG TPA: FMN-binding negative transcriptional regulator [Azospira sp.]|nr:FMN-binding negative transcriptional regulator [Azospira sp.]HNN45924.1 FMN-binding negative transcriptional regulator [Azospira sp.]